MKSSFCVWELARVAYLNVGVCAGCWRKAENSAGIATRVPTLRKLHYLHSPKLSAGTLGHSSPDRPRDITPQGENSIMSAPAAPVPGSVQRETNPQLESTSSQRQDIANLAYALWQQRGSRKGRPKKIGSSRTDEGC
jgi:hypothetical protein